MSEKNVNENENATGGHYDEAAPVRGFRRLRAAVRRLPGGYVAWRLGVGLVGLLIVVGGVILLPLPGPGWLIIFVGIGVWATEFEWAARLLRFARTQVRRWTDWIAGRSRLVQVLVGLAGLLLVVALISGGWWAYRRL